MPLSLVDVSLSNFGPSLEDLERVFTKHKTRFLFVTHLLGFPAITSELLELCKRHGVQIIEDCCESHGAQFQGSKVGTFGLGGTFSFYYGHHISTIEGGMLSTDDKRLYETLLLLRSHGLLRELPSPKPTPGLDPRFTFLLHGYNVRPTELNGFLGLCQLPRLDKAIEIRNHNLKTWLGALDPEQYHVNFDLAGVSSFSLPLLVKPDSRLTIDGVKAFLNERGVENRPVVSGNICRQPFLKNVLASQPMPNADFIHDWGLYIGNHAHLSTDAITTLASHLNSLSR
jgi:CDP-6-deoxy-D-xylo-4-hexulose-3-dehydrase